MFRNLLIIVAVFGLGWGGSFAAGMTYGQRQAALASPVGAGGQSGARAIGASTPQPGGAGQTGGFGGQGGPGGRMTVGTVSRVDGLTVFLTTGRTRKSPLRCRLRPRSRDPSLSRLQTWLRVRV